MATPSDFSMGLGHEFSITACKVGWEPKDLSALAQDEDKARKVLSFIRGEATIAFAEKVWKTWKTVTIGVRKSADEYREVLKAKKMRIGDRADDILSKISFTDTEESIDLVEVSVAELGFPQGATRARIYDKARELGLDTVPAEVGPALRESYTNQPKGEGRIIAMESITDSDDGLEVFDVAHDDLRVWLCGGYVTPDIVWNPGHVWVFRRKS